MAAPNIVNVTTITGKVGVANVTTSFANLVVNSASSGKVVKLNTLYVTNVESSSNTVNLSIGLVKSGYSYALSNVTSIPAGSTLDVISKSIYLEEGDYIQIKGSADNGLHSICSFEEIS